MSTGWVDASAVVVALLVVLMPGALVASAARLAGTWWLAAVGPFSVALIGGTGVMAAWLGVPFGALAVAVVTLIIAALATVVPAIIGRTRPSLRPVLGNWNRAAGTTLLAVVAGAVAIVLPVALAMGSLDTLSQSYDGVFHLNAVAYVLDTGDASSFHLYRMTHPGDDVEFYPAAWHATTALVVQLTGASVPVAMNAVWGAATAAIWVPGAALLSACIWRRTSAGAIGALLASAFAAFPMLLLTWGTLYPTGLAYAVIPLGLAALTTVLDREARAGAGWALGITAVGWLVAEVFSHPRSLPSFAVVAAPLMIMAFARALRGGWRTPRYRRRIVIGLAGTAVAMVTAGALGWLYVWRTYDVANRPISDHLNGGPATARQSFGDALTQALTLSPTQALILFPPLLLAAATLFGVVVAVRRDRAWLAIAWTLVVMLFALASGSNSDFAKLATGIWYKDQFRLFALLPVVAVPMATAAILEAASRLSRRHATAVAAALTALVIATAWCAPATRAVRADITTVFATPGPDTPGVMIDADEFAFLADIDRYVPEGEIVGGDPWNGSALVWAIGGRQAMFPHFTGEWSPDALLVAGSLDRANVDPAVCAAVSRLGLRYVLDDPGLLWGDPPEAQLYAGFHRATESGVLTEIAHRGATTLYRVAACGASAAGD